VAVANITWRSVIRTGSGAVFVCSGAWSVDR
jgi:hypothetical protein